MTKMNKLAAALLIVALGVNVNGKVLESSVATVNGKPILASEYNNYLQGVIDQYKANAPQALEQPYAQDILGKEVLKGLISNELVYQAAEEAKITVKDSELDETINNIKNSFIIDEKTGKEDPKGAEKRFNAALKKQGLSLATYKKKITKDIQARKLMELKVQEMVKPVEEADVKALYENVNAYLKNNTKKMKEIAKDPAKAAEAQAIAAKLKQLTSEQVLIGHIYLATTKDMAAAADVKKKEELAKKIKKEIDGGMDFSAAVKTYSEDAQAVATGGDMILIKGVAPKEIDAKAFTLSVGKISDPIKTDMGYHIIKIKEKRAEKQVGYDDIKRDLGQYIAQTRVQGAIADYLGDLYDKADIKVTKEFEIDKAAAKAHAEQEAAAKGDKKADVKADKKADTKTDTKK